MAEIKIDKDYKSENLNTLHIIRKMLLQKVLKDYAGTDPYYVLEKYFKELGLFIKQNFTYDTAGVAEFLANETNYKSQNIYNEEFNKRWNITTLLNTKKGICKNLSHFVNIMSCLEDIEIRNANNQIIVLPKYEISSWHGNILMSNGKLDPHVISSITFKENVNSNNPYKYDYVWDVSALISKDNGGQFVYQSYDKYSENLKKYKNEVFIPDNKLILLPSIFNGKYNIESLYEVLAENTFNTNPERYKIFYDVVDLKNKKINR